MKCLVFLLMTLGLAMSLPHNQPVPIRDPQERDPVWPEVGRDLPERHFVSRLSGRSDPQERDLAWELEHKITSKSISLMLVTIFIGLSKSDTVFHLLLGLIATWMR